MTERAKLLAELERDARAVFDWCGLDPSERVREAWRELNLAELRRLAADYHTAAVEIEAEERAAREKAESEQERLFA
jgi:hypothetical protein